MTESASALQEPPRAPAPEPDVGEARAVERARPAVGTRAILVTGAHRSGTTWVGKMLAASRDPVGYIREPFGVRHRAGICAAAFPYWFPYVCAENEGQCLEHVSAMLRWEYQAEAQLRSAARGTPRAALDWLRFGRNARRHAVPLLKDPIAVFSAEWLAREFGASVAVVVRHPAAFVASLKRLGWTHPFADFLAQPLLMRDLLEPYAEPIERFAAAEQPVVEQGILLWNVIHDVVLRYRERHADWTFVRLEDLSLDPLGAFGALFERLDLVFDERARARVRETTDPRNPAEASRPDSVHRHSAAHVSNWKRTLTPDEALRVREGTAAIAAAFYGEEDW
jgi:hypothetical protein